MCCFWGPLFSCSSRYISVKFPSITPQENPLSYSYNKKDEQTERHKETKTYFHNLANERHKNSGKYKLGSFFLSKMDLHFSQNAG